MDVVDDDNKAKNEFLKIGPHRSCRVASGLVSDAAQFSKMGFGPASIIFYFHNASNVSKDHLFAPC